MADDKKTTKSETEMEKIEEIEKKEESRSANFEKLRDDLFREAAKLVSEDPSRRIAILVAPPRSESDHSIQSFGYPSAEGVVQKFLKDTRPEEDDGEGEEEDDDDDDDDEDEDEDEDDDDDDDDEEEEEEEEEEEDTFPKGPFWWEDEKLVNTKNPEELMAAIYEMSRLKNRLRTLKNEEQLKAAIDESSRRKDHILMRARERGQGSSGNQDEAGPKP